MNGEYVLNRDLFFQLEEGGRRRHDQRLFKRRFRLILESMLFVTELLTAGTQYPQVALAVILLTLLRSIPCLNWNWELYSFIVS